MSTIGLRTFYGHKKCKYNYNHCVLLNLLTIVHVEKRNTVMLFAQ